MKCLSFVKPKKFYFFYFQAYFKSSEYERKKKTGQMTGLSNANIISLQYKEGLQSGARA